MFYEVIWVRMDKSANVEMHAFRSEESGYACSLCDLMGAHVDWNKQMLDTLYIQRRREKGNPPMLLL